MAQASAAYDNVNAERQTQDEVRSALQSAGYYSTPLFLRDPWLTNVEHLGVAAAREPLLIQLNNFALLGALMSGVSMAMLIGVSALLVPDKQKHIHPDNASPQWQWDLIGQGIMMALLTVSARTPQQRDC